MRHCVSIATSALAVVAVLSLTNDARAQDASPTPSSPPAAPGTPSEPPAAVPVGTAAPAPADKDKEPEESGRLRIGFNFLNGGLGTGGNLSGPTVGATFRIGWQLNRLMGIYGNVSPFVWIGKSDATGPGGATVDVGATAGTQFTPLFALSPIDIVEIAGGPSLDYLSQGSASVGGATAASAVSGMYFGLHGKVALHLGGRNEKTGRRSGFTIEGNVHPAFVEGSTITFLTAGLGYDWL